MKNEKQEITLTLKKYVVSLFVRTPEGREFMNTVFVDAANNHHAFSIAHAIVKVPQFSTLAYQAEVIPSEEENKK